MNEKRNNVNGAEVVSSEALPKEGGKVKRFKAIKITESAVMIALAAALSIFPIVSLPYGGSITLFSMVPIIVIAYRHKTVWGLFTALAYALIQLILGFENVSYGVDLLSKASIIVLDYLVAFTAIGLAGLLRNRFKNQTAELVAGTVLVCAIRYLCHTLVGATVWAGLSIPTAAALSFSLIYNATYMIPETFIAIFGVYYLAQVFDFREENLFRKIKERKKAKTNFFLSLISKVFLVAALVIDVVLIFSKIQGEAGFDIVKIKEVNWLFFLIASALGVAGFVVFKIASHQKDSSN